MNLIRKGHGHSHRGIIGVESAIVMIAFVIVAAALAFVVLNMGFSTTQKAKTTIGTGLTEASSSLSVSGKIIALACTSNSGDTSCASTPTINATGVPVKISSGGNSVNLDPSLTSVKYLSNSVQYDDIYRGTLNSTTYTSLTSALAGASPGGTDAAYLSSNPFLTTAPSLTTAFTYWGVTSTPQNSILDQGEHATLAIVFSSSDRPQALDKMRLEVVVAEGAALTVERDVPTLTNDITDLG